jgi:pyridoxamine 5'-phosphate oxidase
MISFGQIDILMSDIRSNIFAHRKDFDDGSLSINQLNTDPIIQFETWLGEALEEKVQEPYAFCLSTISADGSPSARIVYLREVLDEGLVFYTNYESAKGKEIAGHKQASYTFFWNELHRQVRVKGILRKVDSQRSDRYFDSRPRASQIGAWASDQSSPLHSREELQSRLADCEEKYKGKEIPRPPHWGGYVLIPSEWEFWKGRSSRLHDRFQYRFIGDSWKIERLNP